MIFPALTLTRFVLLRCLFRLIILTLINCKELKHFLRGFLAVLSKCSITKILRWLECRCPSSLGLDLLSTDWIQSSEFKIGITRTERFLNFNWYSNFLTYRFYLFLLLFLLKKKGVRFVRMIRLSELQQCVFARLIRLRNSLMTRRRNACRDSLNSTEFPRIVRLL